MRRTPASPVAAMDGLAERADVGAGAGGLGEQRQRGRRGAGRPILGMDGVAPGRLAAMLAQERAGGGIEEADVHAVPLDRDFLAEPAGRRGVVGVLDLDAAVEMDRARAELVVAKRLERQRPERRPLLGEHGGDLALGGAVDASVGPARVPAVEVGLRRFERLEAQALERGLGVADGRLHFAFPIRIPRRDRAARRRRSARAHRDRAGSAWGRRCPASGRLPADCRA